MALTAKQVAVLQQKMLHKRLYVIFTEPTEKAGQRRKVFPKHIAYQLELERKGILFAAGPIVDEKGQSQGPGMIVIRARNIKVAKRIADNDPFHKLGYRKYTIRGWMVNEGGFNLRINFADGSFALD
jgi:uncharacterized protein YciI